MEMGIADDHVLLCEDGDVVELTDAGLDFAGEVPAGYLYVDGIVGDVGRGVLRDRRVLAEEGVVVVVVTVDARTGEIVAGPEIITRGWVYAPEAESLLEEARKVITISLEEAAAAGRDRLRHAAPPRPPGRGPVRQRAHPAPTDDRADRHGGLTSGLGNRRLPGGGHRPDRGVLNGWHVPTPGDTAAAAPMRRGAPGLGSGATRRPRAGDDDTRTTGRTGPSALGSRIFSPARSPEVSVDYHRRLVWPPFTGVPGPTRCGGRP